jgi:MoaA/NifB/PqqE/SkfB family radical SAM enzyme
MPAGRALHATSLAAPTTEIPAFPWPAPERAPAPAGTVALRNVYLHVTKACNLRCAYCYFTASKPLPGEMTAAELGHLWPELVAVRPQKVVFTGGEPLLREDILDLLAGLRDADPGHHVRRCLNSNGHLVTAAVANALVGLADEVRVSIDALADRNDAHRGAGNFAAALAALDCYYAAGFEPKALVTVTATTLPDLEDLLCLLAQHKITRVNLNLFRPIGRGRNRRSWMVAPEQVHTAVRRAWERSFPDRPVPPDPPRPGACANCGVGSFLNIMPNGDVFPCHVLTQREFRCGNLREEGLAEICRRGGLLGRLQALDFRDLARTEKRLAELTRPGACMGSVYATTKELPVLNDNLPLAARAARTR